MAITPPTRTSGSLGTTKSDANPVTNEPQQLSADQYNNVADNLIAVINQSNANEAAIPGAILWEWNGADVSQFDAPVIFTNGDAGTLAGTLSVGTTDNSPQTLGNALVLAATGSNVSGDTQIVFPITQTLPLNYEVEIFSQSASNNGATRSVGFFVMGDLSGSGFGYILNSWSRRARVDAGALNNGSAGSWNFDDNSQLKLRNEWGNRADYPRGQLIFSGQWAELSRVLVLRNANNASDGDWDITAGLPPAGWAGTSANRFGLTLQTNGALTAPSWSINSIRIKSI